MVLLNLSSANASSGSDSQYSITFSTWQKFSKIRLLSAVIPNVQYNVPSGGNTLSIGGSTITIPPGSYSISLLWSLISQYLPLLLLSGYFYREFSFYHRLL
jgi:hypothetical protein